MLIWTSALLSYGFAASLLPQHFKPGRYSNGQCTVSVELDQNGMPLVDVKGEPGLTATSCSGDSKDDCGELRIPFRPRVLKNEIKDFSLYPRNIQLKSFEKKGDGSIAFTFRVKENSYLVVTNHHSEMSLVVNAQGEPTEASGFWSFNEGGFSKLNMHSRIVDRCKNLKPEGEMGSSPAKGSEVESKVQSDSDAIK